jgi:glutaconate CoA-transferase subunit B
MRDREAARPRRRDDHGRRGSRPPGGRRRLRLLRLLVVRPQHDGGVGELLPLDRLDGHEHDLRPGAARLIDDGVLGATQIDLFGNINSTMLGDDWRRRPKRRFPASGGRANEVVSFCSRTIVIMMHEPRHFVPRVDFVTSPGYLEGMPDARERAGLPAGTSPWRVVTSKGLFGFDEQTRELMVLGVLGGLSVDEVVKERGVKPCVPASVERLAPPTERELEILREHIDPGRAFIGRTAKT